MLSTAFLQDAKENLLALDDQLKKEMAFASQFIAESKRPENEIRWFIQIHSLCSYGSFLIKNLTNNLDKQKNITEEQISFYIGKIAIQSFLDIINAFELTTKILINENSYLNGLLNESLNDKILIIEESWVKKAGSKSKNVKNQIIGQLKNKRNEMNYIRDILYSNNIIDNLDLKILRFSWDIRNSMHDNFLAIKDIEFSAPGTSLKYSFNFVKGEELYHPKDLLSFYQMTEQIIFIQKRIIERINEKTFIHK